MDKLLSKREIENLYKEYKATMHSRYGIKNMEDAVTELIAIKINSLIKNGHLSANNYIDQTLNISSLCKDVMLYSYGIKDSQLLFTIKDNVLSGHIYRPTSKKKKDSFINIIEINDRFLLTSKINVNNSPFFKNLLRKNDIICADIYFPKIKKNLSEKYLASMNDRILHNMFIESQFRKNDIKKSRFNKNEIKSLVKAYDEKFHSKGFSVEETILNDLQECIEGNLTKNINKLLKNVNFSSPNNITSIDYLFNELFCNMDSLIVDYLNRCLVPGNTQNCTLLTVDLLLIKDVFIDRESKKANIETTLHDLGNLYWKLSQELNNNVHKTLDMAVTHYEKFLEKIKSIFNLNIPKIFDVVIDGNTIKDCIGFSLSATMTPIDQNKYFSYQICFVNSLNKKISVHPLDITKFLSIEVIYKERKIYPLSEEIKNNITNFQGKIESIKSISYYD